MTDDLRKIGPYVGLMASSFSIAQFFTSLPWSWVSDRYGRKSVILLSTAGNAITFLFFGSSSTYYQALLMRSASGFLNGTVGVVKSMIGEITDSSNRGFAFALWESAFGLGQISNSTRNMLTYSWTCNWWSFGQTGRKYPLLIREFRPV